MTLASRNDPQGRSTPGLRGKIRNVTLPAEKKCNYKKTKDLQPCLCRAMRVNSLSLCIEYITQRGESLQSVEKTAFITKKFNKLCRVDYAKNSAIYDAKSGTSTTSTIQFVRRFFAFCSLCPAIALIPLDLRYYTRCVFFTSTLSAGFSTT